MYLATEPASNPDDRSCAGIRRGRRHGKATFVGLLWRAMIMSKKNKRKGRIKADHRRASTRRKQAWRSEPAAGPTPVDAVVLDPAGGKADPELSARGEPARAFVGNTPGGEPANAREAATGCTGFTDVFRRAGPLREAFQWSVLLFVFVRVTQLEVAAEKYGIRYLEEIVLIAPLTVYVLGAVFHRVTEKLVNLLPYGAIVTVWLASKVGGAVPAEMVKEPPPPNYPVPGDSSLIRHLTYDPDSARVHVAESWVKEILLMNAGTVDWIRRQMCRVGAHDDPREIQSPKCIPVDLASGDSTVLRIPLQAPEVVARNGALKLARFKMYDEGMRQVFPGSFALRADTRVRR
jgi:hypothetical protein